MYCRSAAPLAQGLEQLVDFARRDDPYILGARESGTFAVGMADLPTSSAFVVAVLRLDYPPVRTIGIPIERRYMLLGCALGHMQYEIISPRS